MKKNKYFMVNLNEVKKVLKDEGNWELKLDIESFNKLEEVYHKLIIVIPFFMLSQGCLYEIVSNYSFDIKSLKNSINNKDKIIECVGCERVSLSFKTLFTKIDEKEVYNFFKTLEENNLLNLYVEAINNLFYGGLSDEIYFNENKQLQKIRRKYE